MFLAQVERGRLVEFIDLAVDTCANKALGLQIRHELHVLAFTFGDDRCEQHQFAAFRQFQHMVDHLADGLRFQRDIVIGARWRTGAREQQAQVVVDLGDGADRRARIVRRRLLLDRNGRRQALDVIDVGLFHHRQELAGIGRQ